MVVGLNACEERAVEPVEPVDFQACERSVHSQEGEDGIIEKIFELIEPTTKFAVEFGASNGVTDSNVRNLILAKGFGALLMEGDEHLAGLAKQNYADNPRVKAIQAWVYPGNIELLLEENGVPHDLDLLSIDIDSNDFYVWRALHDFRPKVVVMEYNARFPPPQKVVVDFHPMNFWDGTDYVGASLQSMVDLGKKKGYELVYCESVGVNAFFVDKKYFSRFGIADNSASKLYRLPQYGNEETGAAPNHRGLSPWDTMMCQNEKQEWEPCQRELVWDKIVIKKRWVYGR